MNSEVADQPAELVAPFDAPMFARPVHFFGSGAAITELAPDRFRDHVRRYGGRPQCRGAAGRTLLERIEQAELTGRGGAHLPSAMKWRAVRSAAGMRGSVVVANGAEGEPDSRKDAALLELRAHLVLDGLLCAAETLGARRVVVWLHENAHVARAALARALSERPDQPGEPPVEISFGPDRYLSGESSAVVHALSGGPALPTFRTVPSAVCGVDGLPTLVHNVETLARVALLARGAPCATELVTITAGSAHVVAEVPTETDLQRVVARAFGAVQPSAVLIGGYGGSWRRWADLASVTLAERSLRGHGLSLGAGALRILERGTCGLVTTAGIAAYLADEGARQCGPCRFGLPAVAEGTALVAAGGRRTRREARRVEGFLAEISGRGACRHPDGAIRMVRSALAVFADDVAAHRRGRCLAVDGAA